MSYFVGCACGSGQRGHKDPEDAEIVVEQLSYSPVAVDGETALGVLRVEGARACASVFWCITLQRMVIRGRGGLVPMLPRQSHEIPADL